MALKRVVVDRRAFFISYEILNSDKEATILFLHGWGSNKEVMKRAFKEHLREFRHIYIDLPGFGKSYTDEVLDTRDYAKIVDAFCKELGIRKEIIVGHSFGGKVATLLSPKLLVLLSSAGIVWPKPLLVRSKIALYKLLGPVGKKFRHLFVSQDAKGMSENMYETFKKVVDEDFSSIFQNYDKRALILWGREDRATPLKSAFRIASLIKDAEVVVMDGDHFFFLHNGAAIAKRIKEEYEKL